MFTSCEQTMFIYLNLFVFVERYYDKKKDITSFLWYQSVGFVGIWVPWLILTNDYHWSIIWVIKSIQENNGAVVQGARDRNTIGLCT